MDPRDPAKQHESLMESIRPTRRRGPLAAFGDQHASWTVPFCLVLLAVALAFTWFYLPYWQYLTSGLLFLLAAGASHVAMRKDHAYALPAGILAVLACVSAAVVFSLAPH